MSVLKTVSLKGRTFELTALFSEMDHDDLENLTDAVISYTGGLINMSREIEFILSAGYELDNAPFTRGDLENDTPTANLVINGVWEDVTEEQAQEEINRLQDLIDSGDLSEDEETKLQDKIDELEGADFCNYPEVLEWWLIDERLLYRLNEAGEVVLDGKYWGRTCSGQSVSADNVIQKVCFELAQVLAR